MHYCRVAAVFAMAMFAATVSAASVPDLSLATNLLEDARKASQKRVPLVILFSLPNCPHCDAVRLSHLIPLQKSPESPFKPILRQINVNGKMPLVNLDGTSTTHGEFARSHAIKIAPVLVFLDKHGKPLAAPLAGSMLPDFYGAYLENSLKDSLENLGNPDSKKSGF